MEFKIAEGQRLTFFRHDAHALSSSSGGRGGTLEGALSGSWLRAEGNGGGGWGVPAATVFESTTFVFDSLSTSTV